MRGVSRTSLAQAKEHLSEVLAGDADPGQLGDQLFAVTALLDSEAGLRRTLSDPTLSARAKTGLVHTLLDGKVAAPTLDVAGAMVGERWSEPRDLADATEELAALAIVEVADRAGQLDELEDELFRFGRVVSAEPELRTVLWNPFFPERRKRDLLNALLDGKVTQPAMRLITQSALQTRGRTLDASLEEFARLAAERRERLVAEVHVAIPLTARQRGRLAAALAASYGHDVHLNIALDPKVIGGMSIQVAGERIDGTMAGRLAGLRRKLAA
jgi:F-type H+-transporting ATPase subunit delta